MCVCIAPEQELPRSGAVCHDNVDTKGKPSPAPTILPIKPTNTIRLEQVCSQCLLPLTRCFRSHLCSIKEIPWPDHYCWKWISKWNSSKAKNLIITINNTSTTTNMTMCREQNAQKKLGTQGRNSKPRRISYHCLLCTGVEIAKWYSKVERTKLWVLSWCTPTDGTIFFWGGGGQVLGQSSRYGWNTRGKYLTRGNNLLYSFRGKHENN